MQIKSKTLSFPPSDSPDVIGYKLYYEEAPNAPGYDSPVVDLGNVTTVDLATLAGFTTMDGTYNLGVTAVDDAGNESSMSILNGVALDFEAPNPPGPLSVV